MSERAQVVGQKTNSLRQLRVDALPVRLQRKIRVSEDGCWVWTGARSYFGYGVSRSRSRYTHSQLVHRFSYEMLVGVVPQGLDLDHLCRNPPCCNPAHLEPVTHRENLHRGIGNASRTHCRRGHPLSGENLRVYAGRRHCKACSAMHAAARRVGERLPKAVSR